MEPVSNNIRALRRIPEVRPVFRAQFVSTYDGDSPRMRICKWHGDESVKRCRLLGIDTAEMTGATKAQGIADRGFAYAWFTDTPEASSEEWPFVLEGEKYDSFGRLLAHVWRAKDGSNLVEALLEAGHGVPRSAAMQLKEAR